MIKKKTNYDVETVAKCLTNSATDEAGVVAFRTFRSEEVEISNDYHIPFHAICAVKVAISTEEVEVDDPTCQDLAPKPYIEGADDTSMRQGTEFDLSEGVTAYDADGNEIPFTVEPSEVDSCEVGEQTFTYSAEGVTKERVITVTQIASPTINGIDEPIEVSVGDEFDPMDGVSGVDGNGNEVEVNFHYLRTVLYADGTFIINEDSNDIAANEQEHGSAYYVYPPLDSENDYVFPTQADRYWKTEEALIKSVKFGSPVQPTSMRAWFNRCVELESFDSTNLDTSECTNMDMLFKCESGADNTKLVSLDLSSWNTSKVTLMRQVFNRCTALETLDISSFDTSNVTNMEQMFGNCSSLTELDLSHFDTSNVENMNGMFANCSSLTSLDVTNFDTSNVTSMSRMFSGCSALTTIYASTDFDTSAASGSSMFADDTSLVGGAGTTYVNTTAGKGKTYARIDNPPDAPGYFTAKE